MTSLSESHALSIQSPAGGVPLKVKHIVHLEAQQSDALKKISQMTAAPVSALIRKAVAEFLAKKR